MREQVPTVETSSSVSRRKVVTGMVASLGTLLYAGSIYRRAEAGEVEQVAFKQEETESEQENKETLPESPLFYQIMLGRIIEQTELSRDQVVFVDSYGRPLSGAVNLTPSNGYKVSEIVWRYKGGKPVGIPGSWTRIEKEKIAAKTGVPVEEIDMHHVYLDILKEKYKSFEHKVDVAKYYAEQVVPGDPAGRTLYEVVRDDVPLDGLPPSIEPQMKRLMLGIAAEESRFNKNKVSPMDARGVLQTMEDTEKGYRKKHKLESLDPTDILMQVGVAGMHIETSYRELFNSAGTELQYIKDTFFDGDETKFETCFVVPALVNAYNAGARRVSEVITWFVNEVKESRLSSLTPPDISNPAGFDVYMVMVHACSNAKAVKRFGPDASQYTEKVYAWAVSMQDTFERPELVAQSQ